MMEFPILLASDAPAGVWSAFEDDQGDDVGALAERERALMVDLHTYMGRGVRPDNSSMEEVLAKELEQLSFEEREKAAFDVHGLSCDGNSSSSSNVTSLERDKLQELDQALQKTCSYRDSPLVRDIEFRLMFLRCDNYDVTVASQRIQQHMRVKRKLFGEEALHRPLKPSDLTPMEQFLMDSPFARHLPQRDSAGRLVVCMNHVMRHRDSTLLNIQRGAFYLLQKAALLPDVQQNGIILVVLFGGAPLMRSSFERWEILQKTREVRYVVPRKVAAVHFCLDTTSVGNATLHKAIPLVTQLAMRQDVRMRFRHHTGNKQLIKLKLQSYGINLTDEDWPDTNVPYPLFYGTDSSDKTTASSTGRTPDELDNYSAYTTETTTTTTTTAPSSPFSSTDSLGTAETEDSGSIPPLPTTTTTTSTPPPPTTTTTTTTTITPTEDDVLLGRGKHTRNHPGNIRAGKLVDFYRDEYEAAPKFQKTAIAERIVKTIRTAGGRFLKLSDHEPPQWQEVDDQTARNKISHMYRNTRKK